MSRGFVKEDDQEEILIVLPRADLPEGVTNYVTQIGMNQLLKEQQELIEEREQLNISDENEKRIAVNHINATLQLLNNRIATARIIKLFNQEKDIVLFGATIALKTDQQNKLQQYQIVGVDEADITKSKISFISPIAKLLINKKVGDKAILKLPKANRIFEIMKIEY